MKHALIGYTGFVGGQLGRQADFDANYNSSNIEDIGGRSFETIVCAGAPAVKWLANREPEQDRATIDRLIGALAGADADRFILISTVDVYPRPIDVTEATEIDNSQNDTYGANRRRLEQFVESRYGSRLIVRLPGLFGDGLKKNVIFDMLHDNRLDLVNPESVFQFYDLEDLWADIWRSIEHGLDLVNFATEPVSVEAIAGDVFDRVIENDEPPPAARYDMKTKHSELWGRTDGYLHGRDDVLRRMRSFVDRVRSS
jgi:nucleoside-diphosphate-sugar epimerase